MIFLNVDENQEKLTFFYKNIDKACINSMLFLTFAPVKQRERLKKSKKRKNNNLKLYKSCLII